MNHFLLHLLAAAVSSDIRGRRIAAIRLLPPVLTIVFEGERDTRYGVAVLSAPGPFFFVGLRDPAAGLGAEVFKRIRDFEVRSVTVPPGERVLRIELGGQREPLTLALQLFGSAVKARLEGSSTVIESLDPAEGGAPLPEPGPPRGTSLVTAGPDTLRGGGEKGDAFSRGIPGMTPELADRFAAPDGTILSDALLRFRDELLGGRSAFVLGTRKRFGSVCPLPAGAAEPGAEETLAIVRGPFADAAEACRTVGEEIVMDLRNSIVERLAAPLAKHLAGRKKLLAALEADLSAAQGFDSLRKEANILAAYQTRIPAGAAAVTLPDPYGEGEISIELDPAAPVTEQIKKRFRRAGKLERSQAALAKRIKTVRGEVDILEEGLAAARAAATLEEAVRPVGRLRERFGLEKAPRRVERVSSKSKELRRFDLDGRWFVLVGRSDRENDEITFRIAAPDDYWFHAQHVPGSHVVLKSRGAPGNPPDAILEAAAGIAAHYSKARRAAVVPVVYTRRKYVRKFRGSKPGEVTCEREKTLLAAPRLPDDANG